MQGIERSRISTIALSWFGAICRLEQGLLHFVEKADLGVAPEDREGFALVWHREIFRHAARGYQPWTDMVLDALDSTFRRHRRKPLDVSPDDLEDQMPTWPLPPDSLALAKLGARFKLAVISQMDSSLLAACLHTVPRRFDYLIGSDYSRSFKPAFGYFRLLSPQFSLEEPDELLVVSTSREIDLSPAEAQGHQIAHVRWQEDDLAAPDIPTLTELVA
ncbi:MAG: hypothetical protein KC561_06120, partial [Myxococcales bacterium]|nr:hypothetical protein [Myxococcales bacterium]